MIGQLTERQIEAIGEAHRGAKLAMFKLVRQIHRPPRGGIGAALSQAREAIKALEQALDIKETEPCQPT